MATRFNRLRQTIGWLAAVTYLCVVAVFAQSSEIRTVALRDEQAPGMPVGALFASLSPTHVTLDAAGNVAFRAAAFGGGLTISDNSGIWSEHSGALSLIAREGAQAPDAPAGVVFDQLRTQNFSTSGNVAFYASLTTSNEELPIRRGVWSTGSGSLLLVIGDNGFPSDNPSPLINAAGRTAFSGPGSISDSYIYSEGSGTLELLARRGNQAEGLPSGVSYDLFSSPVLNPSGNVAFRSTLMGEGVEPTNDDGIWTDASGNLELVVRSGSDAPGTSSQFTSVGPPRINGADQLAFAASISGNGLSNGRSIWLADAGDLQLVVRNDDPAPGTEEGVHFAGFLAHPVLNAAGRVALKALVDGPGVDNSNYTGIWAQGAGGLELIARQGDPVPGAPSGIDFEFFTPPAINAEGQVAFAASLLPFPPPKSDESNSGIFATDLNGNLRAIARSGELLEVGPSDFRTVNGLEFVGGTGNEDGLPSGFNDSGQITFSASFTDGTSGVFVSNLVAITSLVPGDYNEDGIVNAADYAIWRNHEGTNFVLPNRSPDISGDVGQADYDFWVANFSKTSSVSDLSTELSVPEPASWFLVFMGFVAVWCRRSVAA